ncbi:Protein GrpE [Candidatus Sulfotelmatomonas gaucii]|uniref:Protein GrpE n=1 Tax=Candidatus Sulfuritelmatomonas gaucii TaxID=2043161 RepID=A0A2N9LGS7_9BACT|nr:Protein GrpE [Candidatus Sulfotelmatomonas gaucii]
MKQERELTVVDSPEFSEEAAELRDAKIDASAELPAPPAGEDLASPAEPERQAEPVATSEVERLKAERDQLLNRLARLQADFENARKRAERERAEFREFVMGGVVEQFLPVLDNFQLALKSTGTAHQLRSGVSLIVKQMEEILQKMQVTAVPTVGEAFDPHIHEALGTVECDDVPDQHVAEEIRRGYRMRERLLRPALVRVAHNPKQVEE